MKKKKFKINNLTERRLKRLDILINWVNSNASFLNDNKKTENKLIEIKQNKFYTTDEKEFLLYLELIIKIRKLIIS